jgi:uncharacterized membrane protein
MFQLWLFLHVLGAIVAFGFGFYAPVFGMMAAKEPQHGNWYMRTAKRLSNTIIVPVAISMFVTGTLLVVETGGMRRFEELWLTVAVILYVIALVIVFALQRPALSKAIALSSEPPGPEGPPAELAENVRRMQIYGLVLLVLTIAVLALMVWKPVL